MTISRSIFIGFCIALPLCPQNHDFKTVINTNQNLVLERSPSQSHPKTVYTDDPSMFSMICLIQNGKFVGITHVCTYDIGDELQRMSDSARLITQLTPLKPGDPIPPTPTFDASQWFYQLKRYIPYKNNSLENLVSNLNESSSFLNFQNGRYLFIVSLNSKTTIVSVCTNQSGTHYICEGVRK